MSYILKTYTKGEYPITNEQELKLRNLGISGKIIINGSTIMANNIAEIKKIEDEESRYPLLPTVEEVLKSFSPGRRQRALESMIKGFKKHFAGRQMPRESEEMLKKMEYRLELCKLGK